MGQRGRVEIARDAPRRAAGWDGKAGGKADEWAATEDVTKDDGRWMTGDGRHRMACVMAGTATTWRRQLAPGALGWGGLEILQDALGDLREDAGALLLRGVGGR